MKRIQRLFIIGLAFFAANCVSLTVNVYFPTKEIKQAAEEIEERVRSGKGTEGLESSMLVPETRHHYAFLQINFGVREVYAAEGKLDFDISTPDFKKLIKSRTKRYKEIEPYMDKGILGEGLDGYLALRDKKDLNLKELTQVQKLIQEENKDRLALFKEILEVNKVEPKKENIEKAGKSYAEVIRKKLEVGHYYQIKGEDKEKPEWIQMTKEEKKRIEEEEKEKNQ